jgi:hypothetical protein
MLNTNLKAEIIFEFINEYSYQEVFEDFFTYNDLGVPMAVMIVNELIEINEKGQEVFDETWLSLCEELNDADPNYDYESLAEMLDINVPEENKSEDE